MGCHGTSCTRNEGTLLANKHEFSEGRGGSKWLIACSLAIFENRGTRWLKNYVLPNVCLVVHSPEIRGLCFMELSNWNLPNFWEYENPHDLWFIFSLYECPSLCWHSTGYSFIMKKKINTRMKRFSRQTWTSYFRRVAGSK